MEDEWVLACPSCGNDEFDEDGDARVDCVCMLGCRGRGLTHMMVHKYRQ